MNVRAMSCALALALAASAGLAQTSEYLVVAGDNGDLPGAGSPRFLVITGGSVDRSWAPAGGTDIYQYAVSFDATIRTAARDVGAFGAEYDLNGASLGPTYEHPIAALEDWVDGTTDGVRNYTIDLAGTVWACDADWSNPVVLFTLPSSDLGSITYDREFGTLWIGRWSATRIEEYEFDGTPLRTINTGHVKNAALAMDPRDGTLWLHDRSTQGTYEQWTRGGVMLQRVAIPGADTYNAIGGEFQFPQCDPDLNLDGLINIDDIDVFVASFLAELPLGDLDKNQTFNIDDIDAYVASFLAGCP